MSGGSPGKNRGNGPTDPAFARQRERLIAGITKAFAERGYAETTVADVARHANLSEAVFYEHFASKSQGLLAAFDSFIDRLVADATSACEPNLEEADWPIQVRLALGAILRFLPEVASSARLFAIWTPVMGGAAATDRILASIERFAALLRSGRSRYPDAAGLPEATEQMLVGGIALLVSEHLLTEQSEVLPTLESQIVEFVLSPYIGMQEAKRVATAELPGVD